MEKYDLVIKLLLSLIGPYISVSFIKVVIRKIAEAATGQLVQLPHGLKLALGLGASFIFFLLIKGGVVVGLPNSVAALLLSLIAKGVYDLIHDLLKKL